MAYDILIKKGKIIDGTGNPWYRADVAIEKGKIVALGRDLGEADKVIDAKGQIVSPGFIDIHSHSDLPVLIDPMAYSKMSQADQLPNTAAHTFPHWPFLSKWIPPPTGQTP